METARLIERAKKMRDAEAEWLSELEDDRRGIEAGIKEAQTDLEETDRDIAERKACIAEYQELIKRLEE